MLSDPITLYKLMILYMLAHVNFPLTNSQLTDFFLDHEYTTYFTLQQALNELEDAGLVVEWTGTAPMALLNLRRNLADEGLGRVLRIAWNLLRNPAARRRVLAMRRTFVKHADHLTGIALIARKPV